MNSEFSKKLIEIRKECSLTQHQVAEQIGVDDSCYAKWEQGKSEPNIYYIGKLCQLFGVESDILLCIKK